MKLTITYEVRGDVHYPCGAYTFINDQCVYGSGVTFDEAKAAMVAKLMQRYVAVPEPETVELEVL